MEPQSRAVCRGGCARCDGTCDAARGGATGRVRDQHAARRRRVARGVAGCRDRCAGGIAAGCGGHRVRHNERRLVRRVGRAGVRSWCVFS
nr:hypothetical protein [Nitrosomonas nitrosa]